MATRTHYDILGVAPDAPPTEIKRRYRELARTCHPDISREPGAADRFKQINEAHRVLSDPQRRAAYDEQLGRGRRRESPPQQPRTPRPASDRTQPPDRAGAAQRPASPTPPPAPPQHEATRTAPPPRPPRTPPASAASRARTPEERDSQKRQEEIAAARKLADKARALFKTMRFREAERHCRAALQLDRASIQAYEVLGDIHQARGNMDEALAMYSFCLQLRPGDSSLQAKFDRIAGRPAHQSRAAAGQARASGPVRAGAPRATPGARRTVARSLVTGIGTVLMVWLVWAAGMDARTAIYGSLLQNPVILFHLAMAGAAAGLLLSANEVVARSKDELGLRVGRGQEKQTLLLGLILALCAVIWFPAAFLIYVLIGYVQESVSRSVLRAFAAAFGLAAAAALASGDAAPPVLLFGGNVVFPAVVGGWILGDTFR